MHSFEGPAAPDPSLPLPEMPSQSAVTAEIYRSHLGKGKWINTMGDALVPHGEGGKGAASALSPAALFGGGLPLSPQVAARLEPLLQPLLKYGCSLYHIRLQEAARLERQAAASGGMAGALGIPTDFRFYLLAYSSILGTHTYTY